MSNQKEFTIRFKTNITGMSWVESFFVEKAFLRVYNAMADNEQVIKEFNKAFEKYYPNEMGANKNFDNAYAYLGFRIMNEIADKLSPVLGLLPTGRCVYLDPEEPVTFKPDEGIG